MKEHAWVFREAISLKGGPVGTVIGFAIGLFSAGSIAYTVIQAATLGKGFYIGITWNGPYPNPDMGTW